MNRLYKAVLLALILVASVSFWLMYSSSGVPILAYHRVSDDNETYSIAPAEFERQMQYLAQHGYTALSLAEMRDAFARKRDMPAKPVVITFDDGYADNFLVALPIMEKYGFKATVFVIAGQVGQPGYLSWNQIKAMQNRNTEIGSHTLSHVALSEVKPDEQLREISQSKEMLEQNIGTPVRFLAYPYGKFSDGLFGLLANAEYQAACTGRTGLNFAETNPYALKRINIPQPQYGLLEFRARLIRANVYHRLSR